MRSLFNQKHISLFRATNVRRFSEVPALKKVGFIGVGRMGRSMALNLVKAGYEVTVFDSDVESAKKVEGAKVAPSIKELAANSDVVVTMLPNPQIVKRVYKDIAETIKEGSLVIDSSTVDPNTAKKVGAMITEKKSTFMDAPVSGGVGGAAQGTLTFMIGGVLDSVTRASPILTAMGKNMVLCGKIGAGQAAKLCNNLALGINMIGASEALMLGQKLGVNSLVLSGIINTSSGQSWVTTMYNPAPGVVSTAPANNDYKPGFGADLMLKDLRLANEAAELVKLPLLLGAKAMECYDGLPTKFSKKDFSVIFEWLKDAKPETASKKEKKEKGKETGKEKEKEEESDSDSDKKPASKPKKTKKEKTKRRDSAWIEHIRKVRDSNPKLKFVDLVALAKQTYTKPGTPTKVAPMRVSVGVSDAGMSATTSPDN